MTPEQFLAEGKAKIEALFASLEHVSASIGDVKALGALILEHMTNAQTGSTQDEAPPGPVVAPAPEPAPVAPALAVVPPAPVPPKPAA